MITAKNLTKKYGNFLALNKLNLQVNSGEIFCLLGANGAGKTTTISLFLNFIEPSSGEARINGMSVVENAIEIKKHIAYIPENLMLYPNLTGMENLKYFSGLAGKFPESARLEELLHEAGLQASAYHRKVSSYSKGMRQKVGIAIALAKETPTNRDPIKPGPLVNAIADRSFLSTPALRRAISTTGTIFA